MHCIAVVIAAHYIFSYSEFEADDDNLAGPSGKPSRGVIVRNAIVQDMISLILQRVVPKIPSSPKDYVRPFQGKVLTRDEIIREALEQAYLSKTSRRKPLHTQPLLQPTNLNRKQKIPPIRARDDPDLRELIKKGRADGYSEAALLKTRRDNNTRRLMVPNKEEAETVEVWRLEEQYRSSINKLKGYST